MKDEFKTGGYCAVCLNIHKECSCLSNLLPTQKDLDPEIQKGLDEFSKRQGTSESKVGGFSRVTQWVNVKEELPTNDDEVLCYVSKGGRMYNGSCIVLYYDNGKWFDDNGRDYENSQDFWFITHWMELPEKPNH